MSSNSQWQRPRDSSSRTYSVRNWQRQHNGHAYSLGTVFCQMLMPFVGEREQNYFRENSRFLLTMTRDHNGEVLYFPGRANVGGDSQLGIDRVRFFLPGFAWAIASGNLPSFPVAAGAGNRLFVRMNAPRNDWPQLAARRVKVTGLSHQLDLDVTDYRGDVMSAGYVASWSQLTGNSVGFSSVDSLDTTVTFPAAGTYRLQLSVSAGASGALEAYDFEVAASVTPPDTTATVTLQPRSRHFAPGDSAVLTTAVSDGGPFVYQWKLDGADFGAPAASPELILANPSAGSAGTYQCFIWHPGGVVATDPCQLRLIGTSTLVGGGLKREVWHNTSGVTVANLTGLSAYPRCPDVTGVVTEAEAPRDYGDLYGQRLSGWVIPPVSGNYTFYLATDDAGELRLSSDETSSKAVKIAQITPYAGYRAYSAGPSAAIPLIAGKRYYIEALQIDGGGPADHLSVAWRMPGDPVPANGSAPIPGTYLEYETFTPEPGFEDLVSWWSLDEGGGTQAFDAMATANEGTISGAAWTAGKNGGALLFDGTDKVQCSNLGALGGLAAFTAAAWLKVDAGNSQEGVIVQQRMLGETVGNGQYQLLVNGAGKVRFFCYGDNTAQFNFTGTVSINDGQWHHVACQRDTAGGGKIYVDGLLDGSVSGTTMRNLRTETSIAIGADTRDGGSFFRGAIDDVRIYRCALPAAQIANLAAGLGWWSTAPWTGDSTTGIIPGTAWAYHFGNAEPATVAGQTVTGLAGTSPSAAGRFTLTGTTSTYDNDVNELTALGGPGSAVIGRDFLYGGNPATVTLSGLTSGRSYVATILSVGWEAAGQRQATFAAGGDTALLDQNQFGNDRGNRVDYSFTASASSESITITPVTGNTFHLYGLALRQGYIVTNQWDAGPGSLRQALADAAATPGADTITFAPHLDGTRIDCSSPLVVNDPAGVTVDASSLAAGLTLSGRGANRIFQVATGASLACRRLKLTDGRAAGVYPASYGGAILTQGEVTLTECSISGCSATTAGGAIAAIGNIEVSLDGCSVFDNSAGYGGAVQNEATLIALTSTFARNHATQVGGAISAPFNHSTLLRYCTLAGNSAGASGGAHDGTGLLIESTIAAGNSAPVGPNLNGASVGGSNITSGSASLAPFGDYGGFTPTMPPLPGSPAIDGGSTTIVANPLDQRGFARVIAPDIGAAEYLGGSDLTLFWPGDWDHDGSSNGVELALGTDLNLADPGSSRMLRLLPQGDGVNTLTFGYQAAVEGEVRWMLETSIDLDDWGTVFSWDGSPHFFGDTWGGVTGSMFTIHDAQFHDRVFYRIKVEQVP